MTVLRAILRLSLLAMLFAAAGNAGADQLILKNGDRLSGTIAKEDEETVSIETPYAGTVIVRRADITSIVKGEAAAPAASAQKPEPGKPPRSRMQKGHVKVSATYTRGNTTTDRIYAEASHTSRTAKRRYSLGGKFTRAKEGGVKTASSALGEGNYDWFLDGKDFWYVRGSVERDRFKDIELRNTAGTGYGLQLIDTERSSLAVRAGPDIVMVNRFVGENETYPALGWGVKLSHWVVPDRIEFFHDQDGFWNLDETSEVSVRSRTGVRIPLTDRIDASAQLNLDWEKEPAPGRDSTDSTWLVGVGYSW